VKTRAGRKEGKEKIRFDFPMLKEQVLWKKEETGKKDGEFL